MIEVVNAYVDGRDLLILERGPDGRVLERRERPEYSFFVKTEDLPEDLTRQMRSSRSLRAMVVEGAWIRLSWADDWVRRAMLYGRKGEDGRKIPSPFQEQSIPVYEGDVDPVRRWFTDTKDACVGKPKRGYFDLETDSRVPIKQAREGRARILSIALSNEDETEQWLGVIDADTDYAERDLIAEFFRRIEGWSYTQLLAWGGDNFDFAALAGRIDRLGVAVDVRRYLWLDHLSLFRRMNLNSSDSGEEKQSMALQAIAQAQLGEGKEEIPPEVARKWPGRSLGSLSWELWDAGGEFRKLLGRYNMKDTALMCRIERKTGFASLFDTLCDVCKVLPDSRGLLPTKQMDGFMLRLGLERNFHFPTKYYREDGPPQDPFEGAFVMEPKLTGILRDVHVADFASLYPSVIITWNMSPETKRDIPVNGPIPPGHCRSPLTGVGFATDVEGMLPAALKTMIALRKEWSEKQASLPPGTPESKEAGRRSMAYKVAANSFYGVVGSPFSRYFDRSVAESVTQNAVWLIKRTIFEAEERGMEVIYGDTDSFFAQRVSRTEFEVFTAWCNEDLYPRILAGVGCVASETVKIAIKLAYEKAFAVIVLVGKKRYAGRFDHYKGTAAKPVPREGEAFDKAIHSRPEIKGFEYKRGDCSVLARRLQEKVIMALMRENLSAQTYRDLLAEALNHVAKDELPLSEVQISKTLTKPTNEYHRKTSTGKDAKLQTHVQVAEDMQARGMEIGDGSKVAYVIIDGSDGVKAIPAADYVGELDRYYLWENQVYPPTQRILEKAFPDQDWVAGLERIRPRKGRGGTKQKALFAAEEDPIATARHAAEERHLVEWAEAWARSLEAEIAWRG
jgi:DNA polymerase I